MDIAELDLESAELLPDRQVPGCWRNAGYGHGCGESWGQCYGCGHESWYSQWGR